MFATCNMHIKGPLMYTSYRSWYMAFQYHQFHVYLLKFLGIMHLLIVAA